MKEETGEEPAVIHIIEEEEEETVEESVEEPLVEKAETVEEVSEVVQEEEKPSETVAEPVVEESVAEEAPKTVEENKTEMEKCPFCGAVPQLTYFKKWYVTGHSTDCILSANFAVGKTKEQMMAAWNTRV